MPKSQACIFLSTTLNKIHFLFNDTQETCVLLNSVQEFIGIETWLLLTFFLCLYNQLISINFIVTY